MRISVPVVYHMYPYTWEEGLFSAKKRQNLKLWEAGDPSSLHLGHLLKRKQHAIIWLSALVCFEPHALAYMMRPIIVKSRKSHHKRRTGCKECKTRKVKAIPSPHLRVSTINTLFLVWWIVAIMSKFLVRKYILL